VLLPTWFKLIMPFLIPALDVLVFRWLELFLILNLFLLMIRSKIGLKLEINLLVCWLCSLHCDLKRLFLLVMILIDLNLRLDYEWYIRLLHFLEMMLSMHLESLVACSLIFRPENDILSYWWSGFSYFSHIYLILSINDFKIN